MLRNRPRDRHGIATLLLIVSLGLTPTSAWSACPPTPDPTCVVPQKSSLVIRDLPPAGPSIKDSLVWKYLKGPTEPIGSFDDPTATTDYTFCVYVGATPTLLLEANVAGGVGWQPVSDKGYKFKDSSVSQDGTLKVVIRGNPDNSRSKILWRGKGVNLPVPTLPISPTGDVIVRLHSSTAPKCWGAFHPASAIIKNEPKIFKVKIF